MSNYFLPVVILTMIFMTSRINEYTWHSLRGKTYKCKYPAAEPSKVYLNRSEQGSYSDKRLATTKFRRPSRVLI